MAEISGMTEAIERVHQELDRVRQVKKCVSCECLSDVLQAVEADLAGGDSGEAEAARADFHAWVEVGNAKRHRCLGCEVCLPTEPYNRFSAFLRDAGVQESELAADGPLETAACSCGGT